MAAELDFELGLDILTDLSAMVLPQSLGQPQGFARATRRLHKKSRDWTRGRGTQGLGIGEKVTEGKPTGDLSLKIYVDRKRPRAKLKNPVPKRLDLPDIGKLVTDVEEIGQVAPELFTTRARPAMPGCGLGHPKIQAGTFGCLVRKKDDPDGLYILSNAHVLAHSGLAAAGDAILQPSKFDGGTKSSDAIAVLESFIPFDTGAQGYPNVVDAAIAKVKSNDAVSETIRLLKVKPVGVGTTVKRDMRVQKVGRTTDHTLGIVKDVHGRVRLPYKMAGGTIKRVGFRDVVLCNNFTAGGDSGAAVLNMRERIVGLHFAGSVSSSIFCRIGKVFELLGIEVIR